MSIENKRFLKEDIICYDDFIPVEDQQKLVSYFEDPELPWTMSAFFESYGMSLLPDEPLLEKYGLPKDYLGNLASRLKEYVEDAHQRPVKSVSSHAQKWEKGAFAPFHSDNTDMDGNWSAWEKSKFVCLLYVNDDYEGGELDFRDHSLTIKPKSGQLITFPGGINNVHQVKEVLTGTRHTIGAFWDFAESEYSEERIKEWDEEVTKVREQQAVQQAEWKQGIKNGTPIY